MILPVPLQWWLHIGPLLSPRPSIQPQEVLPLGTPAPEPEKPSWQHRSAPVQQSRLLHLLWRSDDHKPWSAACSALPCQKNLHAQPSRAWLVQHECLLRFNGPEMKFEGNSTRYAKLRLPEPSCWHALTGAEHIGSIYQLYSFGEVSMWYPDARILFRRPDHIRCIHTSLHILSRLAAASPYLMDLSE